MDRGWRHLDLAIIVRTDAGRSRLQEANVKATILTVAEAKGLEFRFVLLVDFLRDCPAMDPEGVWKLPGTDPEAQGDKKYALVEAICELKCLYTAITRARHSCAWLETADEDRVAPIREYLEPVMLTGHSHPGAWTYPVFADRQMDNEVSACLPRGL